VTPYRGGYDLEKASRVAPGIHTQNVVTRSGANLTKQNFFGVLDDISAAVRAENRDGLTDKLLPLIDKFMDSLLKALSTSGAQQARYEGNVTRMKLNDIRMTETHDSLVGVDLAEISTELMMAQALYQASLGVISFIVQPTLLDFLT
jgi:flagellin-like hook-associated protein FlgL